MEQKIWNFSIFKWLGTEYLKKLSQKSCDFKFNPGEVIIKEWDKHSQDVYIISTWKADVSIWAKKVAELEPGDIVWELAFLTWKRRYATVTANSPVCLIKVNQEGLLKILKETPNWKQIEEIVMKRLAENGSKHYKI